jgi:RNA polymerase sigma factor (sigma-70 family)
MDPDAVPLAEPGSAAITAAVERWGGLIRRAAIRHGLVGPDIEEVVQDLRIRLWRALGRPSEKNPTESASYMYRAAMSAALDLLRRRRAGPLGRPVPLEVVSETLVVKGGEPADDEAAQIAALARALDRLLTDRRIAVRLHLSGKSRDEITAVTGWSEAKARNLLYRGLADLKAILSEGGAS